MRFVLILRAKDRKTSRQADRQTDRHATMYSDRQKLIIFFSVLFLSELNVLHYCYIIGVGYSILSTVFGEIFF